jgi:uncharacterized protein (TIGR03790 family)
VGWDLALATKRFMIALGCVFCLLAAGNTAFAGGSGLNVLLVVNQASTNSIELGNYYCEKRQVPAGNVLRITWSGSQTTWTSNDFQNVLLGPLLTMLADGALSNQIDYVVLSMDIPFQTTSGVEYNGTTSALFYGVKDQYSGNFVGNSYASSERDFRKARPANSQGSSFLAIMITGNTLDEAKAIVDQGVASDGTFPDAPVLLAKSSDNIRNMRFVSFDNAMFNARIGGRMNVVRTNMDSPIGLSGLLGLQTGLANFSISPGTFVPGAMADSLTSYGGLLFETGGQTPLLAFLRAGASGSYGTVTEPGADQNKFPIPQNYFFQSRGFSLAECYYQSIYAPYEGILVGEPLAAPFARGGTASWVAPSPNAALSGLAPLNVRLDAADAEHPIQQVDLFLDGKYLRTLTNIAMQAGNQLTVNLGTTSVTYTVTAQETLETAATNLAALLNLPAVTNQTRAVAGPRGDRIELRSIGGQRVAAPGMTAAQTNAALTNSPAPRQFYQASVGTAATETTFLIPGRHPFLNSPVQGYFLCRISGVVPIGGWAKVDLVKTNGASVSVAVTNKMGGATAHDLATNLVAALLAQPALQGPAGVLVEDLTSDMSGSSQFYIRARSPGYFAAGLTVKLSATNLVNVYPTVATPLRGNLTDLQPRNHLYVRSGLASVSVATALDTRQLADGFHELTVVGYEGSSVRTQTRATVPVQIQNTGLSATIDSSDLTDGVSATGTYHVQVAANTNAVSNIKLYSSGGVIASVSNQSVVTLDVSGPFLGAGLHPFYAVVQPATGISYRTRTMWVRLAQ